MQIGAISYQPYIYKPNAVSSSSLSKVNGIGNDLLATKTDFSGVTEDKGQNLNPLKRGETKDFAGILMSQMQMGRMNAARLMTPAVPAQEASSPYTANAVEKVQAGENIARMQQASEAYSANMMDMTA